MRAKFNFLVADGDFNAELPNGAEKATEASTSVLAFGGARDLGFLHSSRFDPASALAHLEPQFDIESDGYRVSIYRRAQPPLTFTAVWWLPNGVLTTFVDESAASAKAMEAVADSIQVLDVESTVPRLGLRPPLVRPSLRDISYRDFVAFDDPGEGVRLTFTEEISRRVRRSSYPLDDVAEAWVTTELGVRVSALGPKDRRGALEQIADEVAESLTTA